MPAAPTPSPAPTPSSMNKFATAGKSAVGRVKNAVTRGILPALVIGGTAFGLYEMDQKRDGTVQRGYTDYGVTETSNCIGEKMQAAEAAGVKADIGAICNGCRTEVAEKLKTHVPWSFVENTWNIGNTKGNMTRSVSHGANLVCSGLVPKKTTK